MEWNICKIKMSNFYEKLYFTTRKIHRETKQLIHRDLAARNVLIGENNVAKVIKNMEFPVN